MRHHHSQLKSLASQKAITLAGGFAFVLAAGTANKLPLYNPQDGTVLANPVSLDNGHFEFNVEDDVEKVDIIVVSPTGHTAILRDVYASGDASVFIDTGRKSDVLIVPFSAEDQAGDNVETDTGIDLPVNTVIQAGVSIDVITEEAGATVDAGTLSTETGGDAAVLVAGADLANLVTVTDQTVTIAGVVVADAVSVSYTLSAGAVATAGFIKIPVQLPVVNL